MSDLFNYDDGTKWDVQSGDYSTLQVDERYWGDGADQIVRDWIGQNYDPETMPMLNVASVKDRDGLWLLGWDRSDTWPPLLHVIFGLEYAERQLAHIKHMGERMTPLEEGQYGMGRRVE